MAKQSQEAGSHVTATEMTPAFVIQKRDRYWQVLDSGGELVCLTVYKRGAREVVRRLTS